MASSLFAPLLWMSVSLSLLLDTRRSRRPTLPAVFFLLTLSVTVCLLSALTLLPAPPPRLPTTMRQAVPSAGGATPPSVSPPAAGSPPSASPIPSTPPTQPPSATAAQQPAPAPQPQPQPGVGTGGTSTGEPTLDACGGALTRMQIVLLLEFFAEVIFVVMRTLATDDEDNPTLEMSYRQFVFARAIYSVPVIALNVSVLWIGGGPTGACLPAHTPLQIVFTHLVLYAMYCIAFVILGLYRLTRYDSEDTDSYTYTDYPSSMRWAPRRKYHY